MQEQTTEKTLLLQKKKELRAIIKKGGFKQAQIADTVEMPRRTIDNLLNRKEYPVQRHHEVLIQLLVKYNLDTGDDVTTQGEQC